MSPWWSLWVNLGGAGNWQFVGWLYVESQELAPGNPKAVVDRVIQGLADQLSSPTFGAEAEGRASTSAKPGTLGRPLAAGECASGGAWYPAQDQQGNFRPVCPNEPEYERVRRAHQEGRGHPLPVVHRSDRTVEWL